MFHGALTVLISGLGLVAIAEFRPADANYVEVTGKSLVPVAIVIPVFRKRATASTWCWFLSARWRP